MCFTFLLGALPGCGESALEDRAAARFLGPLPGTRYEYAAPDGSRMEVAGIAWAEGGAAVLVLETAFLPPEYLPPELMGKASKREYVLRAEGSLLVMEEAGKRTIVADLSGNPWTIPVTTTSFTGDATAGPAESDWVIREAECRMSGRGERVLLGASRKVFTVTCSLAVGWNGGETMPVADLELAEGIGVVRLGYLGLTTIHTTDPAEPHSE